MTSARNCKSQGLAIMWKDGCPWQLRRRRRAEEAIQKLTDRYVAEIDKLIAEKEKEVMTV